MTDEIDLDALDAGEDDEPTDEANDGDWFWRDGAAEPSDSASSSTSASPSGTGGGAGEPDDESGGADADAVDSGNGAADDGPRPAPHVPRESDDEPFGVADDTDGTARPAEERPDEPPGGDPPAGAGDGVSATADGVASHSGGADGDADDMTLAFTYSAVSRLASPERVAADASQWADWLGIVGDVPAHVINKFQRDNGVDADFFNGSGTGPGERLARIGPRSMFFAERMVVVGIEGEDESIAAAADWEFVPLSEAAEKAGWETTG